MTSNPQSQSGNALIFIMVTIALFAALIFTFTRSSEQGTGSFTAQQIRMSAQQILAFAKALEDAVARLQQRAVSENQFDFRNDVETAGYDNADCTEESCRVFSPEGGRAVWQSPPGGIGQWVVTGAVRVNNIGTQGANAENSELLLVLPNVPLEICLALNSQLGIENPLQAPPEASAAVTLTTRFTGAFTAGGEISGTQLNRRTTACFKEKDSSPALYHFYHVLLAR